MEFLLLAQAQPDPSGALGSMFVPILLTVVIFYFFLIRPESKRRKELESQISALRKHDRVLTSGGIIGIVWSVKEKEIVLQVDDNNKTRVHFARSAIVQILESSGKSDKSDKSDKSEKDTETPVAAASEGDKGKGSGASA